MYKIYLLTLASFRLIEKEMRILFVCHGNICRSPMAEFIMKALVRAKGLEGQYQIESAAVSSEETGNPIYPPAKRCLRQHDVLFTSRCPLLNDLTIRIDDLKLSAFEFLA